MDSKSTDLWTQYYTLLDRMQLEQTTYKILQKVFEKFPLGNLTRCIVLKHYCEDHQRLHGSSYNRRETQGDTGKR